MCKDCVILYQVTCVPKAILGRYVTVHVHTATQYLGLSEVEVYGRVGEYAAHIHSCAGHYTLYKKIKQKDTVSTYVKLIGIWKVLVKTINTDISLHIHDRLQLVVRSKLHAIRIGLIYLHGSYESHKSVHTFVNV